MALTNAYTTLDALKRQLGVTETRWDTQLELAIAAASRQIDAHTGWHRHGFWKDSALVTRYYEPEETDCLHIPEGIADTTGLVIKVDYDADGTYETTLAASDYTLEPINAANDYPVRPYCEIEIRPTSSQYFPTGLEYTVSVRAIFGWPAVPAAVEAACLIQAAQLYKAADATFGVLQLTSLDGSAVRIGGSLHPQAEALLVDYSKPRVA